jgi:hypothetical protein
MVEDFLEQQAATAVSPDKQVNPLFVHQKTPPKKTQKQLLCNLVKRPGGGGGEKVSGVAGEKHGREGEGGGGSDKRPKKEEGKEEEERKGDKEGGAEGGLAGLLSGYDDSDDED